MLEGCPLLIEQGAHRLIIIESFVEGQCNAGHVAECAVDNLPIEVPVLITAESEILLDIFRQPLCPQADLVGLEALCDVYRHIDGDDDVKRFKNVKFVKSLFFWGTQESPKATFLPFKS